MLLLSTLVACLHLGVRPPGGGDEPLAYDAQHVFSGVQVQAPVAEPGVDEAVRSALWRALAARGALGGGLPLAVTVTEASLDPAVRGDSAATGGGLWYRARLVARVNAPDRARTFSLEDWVPETGAVPDRQHTFEALAERLAQEIGAWATSG